MDYQSNYIFNENEIKESFYILYDQVIGIESNITLVKILTHLEFILNSKGNNSEKSKIGSETTFYANGFNYEEDLRVALLTVRQPVLECVRNPWIQLMINVQLGYKGRVVNKGRTNVQLFASDGTLQTGCWRSEINFEDEEIKSGIHICYRIVRNEDLSLETTIPNPVAVYAFYQEMNYSSDIKSELSTIGFSIDWIKNLNIQKIKVQLTALDLKQNEVIQSSNGPVSCFAYAEASCYKTNYHEFGSMESIFDKVRLNRDIILIIMVYEIYPQKGINDFCIENLIAWSYVQAVHFNSDGFTINSKNHVLQLYEPPLPLIQILDKSRHDFPFYQMGIISVNILTDDTILPISSRLSISDQNIGNESRIFKREPPLETYSKKDGFDIYVHQLFNLPSNVNLVIISAAIYDKHHQRIGQPLLCFPDFDSDILNQKYNCIFPFRLPDMPSTSTLIIELFTFDIDLRKLLIIGSSILNIFVESGTLHQPLTNNIMQVSLNVGKHQLPLYVDKIDLTRTISSSCFQTCARLPAANIRLSICKGGQDPTKELIKDYEESEQELMINDVMMMRQGNKIRNTLLSKVLSPNEARKCATDQQLNKLLMIKLANIIDDPSPRIDGSYFASYEEQIGFNISIFATVNMPCFNICMPMLFLDPPGDILKNMQKLTDQPQFVDLPILESHQLNSIWQEEYIEFINYKYDQNMLLVIYIPGLEIKSTKKGIEYTIINETWTAKKVFTEDFISHGFFNLPLYKGKPSVENLNFFRNPNHADPATKMTLVENASLIIAMSDIRRKKEILQKYVTQDNIRNEISLVPSKKLNSESLSFASKKLVSDLLPFKNPNPQDLLNVRNASKKTHSIIFSKFK